MSGPRVRIGVAGTSWWTETFHLPGLTSHPRAELVALCGRDRERAAQLARLSGAIRVFTNFEMFSSGLLDTVVIATLDDLHREMTLRALRSGLHVLCEKPLARSAADALNSSARLRQPARYMVMFTWRWLGVFAYLHRLIADGYLRRCRTAFPHVRRLRG